MPLTTDPRLEYLFQRYFEGNNTPEEKEELLNLIHQAQYDDRVKQLMDNVWTKLSPAYHLSDKQSERILSGILPSSSQKRHTVNIVKKRILRWSAVAATLLILLTTGWIFYHNKARKEPAASPVMAAQSKNNILSHGNKTTLILGNGKSVVLDSSGNGIIASQGGIPIIKLNGQLSYKNQGYESAELVYNTILTPRGKQYKVILPDGSKVWLNAASSLRFPTVFRGSERNVELKGEAYFEVAENKDMPFLVNADDMQVKVLGTHFDIMAYKDEPAIKTTLLEGSVKITGGNREVVLKPGQEAVLDHSSNSEIKVKKADVRAVVSWKNGLFLFQNTDLRSVLREIVRWYDVEVTYEGEVNAHLNGMISRNASLQKVLHMLEVTSNIKFRIEGKKIIVTSSIPK